MDTTNLVVGSAQADPTILTEQTATTIKSMLDSSDLDDHKMAQLILNKINVEKSIYWIWYLSRFSRVDRMVNLRTKASRTFRNASDLFYITTLDAASFIAYLRSKNLLTSEYFKLLKEDLYNSLSYRIRGIKSLTQMYNVTLELKDEFKHLDPEEPTYKID